MGYESKLYIVDKKERMLEDKSWGQIIATFELSCFAPIGDYMRNCPVTDCYIYADDGNTQVMEDRYGKPLTESDIAPLIKILAEEAKDTTFGGKCYRRIRPLLAMLEMFEHNKNQWQNIKVLHYGY